MLQRRIRSAMLLALVVMLPLAGPNPALARQEVTGAVAFAGPADFAGTMANSRTTFATSETITFGIFLHTDDLSWSSATIAVYIFDQLGKLRHGGSEVGTGPFNSGIWRLATAVNPGALPAGSYRWLMAVTGNDGTTFVSTFQPLVIQ